MINVLLRPLCSEINMMFSKMNEIFESKIFIAGIIVLLKQPSLLKYFGSKMRRRLHFSSCMLLSFTLERTVNLCNNCLETYIKKQTLKKLEFMLVRTIVIVKHALLSTK